MKKTLVIALLFLGLSGIVYAQEISPNAIGLRIGDNDGFSTEVNYQRALSENNRLELGLAWRSGNNFDAVKGTGIYQWVWNIDGGFNWYAGVGAAVGAFDVDNDAPFFDDDDNEFFVNAAGDIGIEYRFDIPLLLSLDFRPEIGILNDFDDDLEFDVALGIRYLF
ncbi:MULTISPECIES: hypothetical protein [unclassified Dokdonia]|uniref:hypothetical protein n=1 Tax=unclassified Dokdonia TaxID=2615033 RepID=UPI00020A70DE|nr:MULTISPECIES: hypothetical protein [unclassified Dokdonia]AEE18060.1 hypothetical protein Krodi_0069 [Dokdonia sp. 4H-3-7-5]